MSKFPKNFSVGFDISKKDISHQSTEAQALQRLPDIIHLISYHYASTFRCGLRVDAVVDRENNWAAFNKMRTTTIREANCPVCLEWAYSEKLKELNEIAEKLGKEWVRK